MASFLTQRFSAIPKRMRPSTFDIRAAGMWGGTAALGALYLIQPWDFIQKQIYGEPEEKDDNAGNPAPQARQQGTSDDSSEGDDSGDSDSKEDGGGDDEE